MRAYLRDRVVTMMQSLAFALVFAVASASAAQFDDCKDVVKMGIPSKTGTPLCRMGYALAHDPVKKTPIWVAERLTKDRARGKLDRSDDFRPDPDLPTGRRAELADYKSASSKYDRGHMSPAANNAWDKDAMSESFYLSNMVPQVGPGMNRGIWKQLESYVRDWAKTRGEVYIYTGPIYPRGIPWKTIGKNKVGVPVALYKIVYDPNANEAIAFIMPNKKLRTKDMPDYIVTISDVEKQTGLTFLTELSANEKGAIHKKKADWVLH